MGGGGRGPLEQLPNVDLVRTSGVGRRCGSTSSASVGWDLAKLRQEIKVWEPPRPQTSHRPPPTVLGWVDILVGLGTGTILKTASKLGNFFLKKSFRQVSLFAETHCS